MIAHWRETTLAEAVKQASPYNSRHPLRPVDAVLADGTVETTYMFDLAEERCEVPIYRVIHRDGALVQAAVNAIVFPLTTDIDS